MVSLLRNHESDARSAKAVPARSADRHHAGDPAHGLSQQRVVTLNDENQALKEAAAQVEPLRVEAGRGARSQRPRLSALRDKMQVKLETLEKRATDASVASPEASEAASATVHAGASPSVAHTGDARQAGERPRLRQSLLLLCPAGRSAFGDSFDASMVGLLLASCRRRRSLLAWAQLQQRRKLRGGGGACTCTTVAACRCRLITWATPAPST